MTAYVMPGEKEKCLAAGMNDYLAKPIEELELQAILMKYLSKHIVMSALPGKDETRNEFLLNLAGGDKNMVILILNEVKQQLPGEINKLQQVISSGDTGDLPTICHHLLSTISPLGDNTDTVNKIASIQQALMQNIETEKVIHLAEDLKSDLDFFYVNINAE